jgi:hypothetical protein
MMITATLAMDKVFRVGRSRRLPITLDARPVLEEELSASEFLALSRNQPQLIKSSKVIPPKAGKPGFGKFLVRYAHPVYKTPV